VAGSRPGQGRRSQPGRARSSRRRPACGQDGAGATMARLGTGAATEELEREEVKKKRERRKLIALLSNEGQSWLIFANSIKFSLV